MSLALEKLIPIPDHSGNDKTDNIDSPTTLPASSGAEWDIDVKKWKYVAPTDLTGFAKPCGKWVLVKEMDPSAPGGGSGKELIFKTGVGIQPRTVDTAPDKQDIIHDMVIETLPEVP